MQGASSAKNVCTQILRHRSQIFAAVPPKPRCDVFINHRGIDTKRTVSGLLYEHVTRELRLPAFLDNKNMKPGDRLFDHIDSAIRDCKLAITVFSPRYCDSYFCLHELSLILESRKRVIPVFCDVKPSELRVKDDGKCPKDDLERFRWAVEEAKFTVGLAFDSEKGDWAEFLRNASDAVVKNLLELEGDDDETNWSLEKPQIMA